MHSIPDLLYRLTQRDAGQTWVRHLTRYGALTAAALDVQPRIVNLDPRRMGILSTMMVFVAPGAAQVAERFMWYLEPVAGGTARYIGGSNFALAGGVQGIYEWSGECIVPPGWAVVGQGIFSAAVAANTVNMFVAGLTMPLGTIQLSD